MNKRWKKDQTIIMITSGFEEESTVICLKQLRRAGLKVKLVALTAGMITGIHGLTVRPDCSLGELSVEGRLRLMIIPGCQESTEMLLTDPRFHRLFTALAANKGRVAVMRTAENAFGRAGLPEMLAEPHCVRQGNEGEESFIQCLIDDMLS
jgi:putative intracellular protease/amidase